LLYEKCKRQRACEKKTAATIQMAGDLANPGSTPDKWVAKEI